MPLTSDTYKYRVAIKFKQKKLKFGVVYVRSSRTHRKVNDSMWTSKKIFAHPVCITKLYISMYIE